MDLSVNGLKCEEVSLKSECSMTCLQVAIADDTEEVMAGRPRRNSITTFTLNATTTIDTVDGKTRSEQLVALQVKMKNKDCFLCPKKPNNSQEVIKLRPKKIKACKVFDKKDSEIEGKYRKYWFKLKEAGTGDNVFESLAYKNFFISVEGDKVLMRKCSEEIPTDGNYHFDVLPPIKNKYNIEVRSTVETFRSCGEIPSIEVCEVNVNIEVDDVNLTPCDVRLSSAAGDAEAESLEKGEDESEDYVISTDTDTPKGTNNMNFIWNTQRDDRAEEKVSEMSSATGGCDWTRQMNNKLNDIYADVQNGNATVVLISSGECSGTFSEAGTDDIPGSGSDRSNSMNGSTVLDGTILSSVITNGISNGHGPTFKQPIPLENNTRAVKRRSFFVDLFSCVSSHVSSDKAVC